MKKHTIDFDQVLHDHRGKPIIDGFEKRDADGNVVEPEVHLTLGALCHSSFMKLLEEDKTRTSPTAIMNAYTFASRLSGGKVDLTIDEINRVRDRVGKAGWPLFMAGPAMMLLDANEPAPAGEA